MNAATFVVDYSEFCDTILQNRIVVNRALWTNYGVVVFNLNQTECRCSFQMLLNGLEVGNKYTIHDLKNKGLKTLCLEFVDSMVSMYGGKCEEKTYSRDCEERRLAETSAISIREMEDRTGRVLQKVESLAGADSNCE